MKVLKGRKEFMCGKRGGRYEWEKRSSIWFRLLYTGRNKEKTISLNHQVKHAILKFQKSYPYPYKTISCKSNCASQRAHVRKGTNMTTAVIYSSRYLSVLVPGLCCSQDRIFPFHSLISIVYQNQCNFSSCLAPY